MDLIQYGGAYAYFHFFKYPPEIHGSGRTVLTVVMKKIYLELSFERRVSWSGRVLKNKEN